MSHDAFWALIKRQRRGSVTQVEFDALVAETITNLASNRDAGRFNRAIRKIQKASKELAK